jgi:hypothetical protein
MSSDHLNGTERPDKSYITEALDVALLPASPLRRTRRLVAAAGELSADRSMMKQFYTAALLITIIGCEALAFEQLTTARVLTAMPMPMPGYLRPVSDPVFGTSFVRITDPRRLLGHGISCSRAYCRHRYSSTAAWNADASLLLINNGCNGFCFLDGQTYEPAFHRLGSDDCKWHPRDPALMICVFSRGVYTWAPRTNTKTVVYASTDYTNIEFGPYKGNPSQDGKRIVLRAKSPAGALVAFAYDIVLKKKFPDIDLTNLTGVNGYCGISPSGRYITCFQNDAGTEMADIFTIEGARIQHWPEHHRPAHGDMGIDVDGNDVYVGVSKADPDKWHIIKRRLIDGAVTDLTPAGYATHASMRNIQRPGWVFLSYEGTYAKVIGSPGWAPFYQEVVALRIDGSGEIRRIAQTHNEKADYYSESHASPSPDGSQVLWSSNWEEPGGPVADYAARLSWSKNETSR